MDKKEISIKLFLLSIFFLSTSAKCYCAIGDTFTAKTIEGVTVTYSVTSEVWKEVQVGIGSFSKACIASSTRGTVTIPSEVNGYIITEIGKGAFKGCSISAVSLPESIVKIGSLAFQDCSNITHLEIPDGVTFIGEKAFQRCTKLQSIKMGTNVEKFGSSTFEKCSSLTSLVIPDKVEEIPVLMCSYCTNLQTVTFGAGLKVIGSNSFQDCGLKSVFIPNNVTTIRYCAFQACVNLESVYFGNRVESIGSLCFQGCRKLEIIDVSSEMPCEIEEGVFSYRPNSNSYEIYNQATLFVPYGCSNRYKQATGWMLFKYVVEKSPTRINDVCNHKTATIYYNLNGTKSVNERHGLVLKKHNGKTQKLFVK